jgi:hypothetical protein
MDEERKDAIARPATVEARAEVFAPVIRLRQHGWLVWARIAIDHEAEVGRLRLADPIIEYQPGLVAIAAAAFSLDALYAAVGELIPQGPPPGDDAARKKHVADRLRRGVSPRSLSESWPSRIGDLYDTRDKAVHYKEADVEPVWHEVLQSNVSPDVVGWGLEAAESAVDLMLEILTSWAGRPSPQARSWAEAYGHAVADLARHRAESRG